MTRLAYETGQILMKYFLRPHQVERKEGAGIVTEADKAAEAFVLKNLFRKFPQSSIITEESGEYRRDGELCWVIDPLDGTSNYAHGFPWFCVSIGLMEAGAPKAGVIYQPVTREMFYAEKGKGVRMNGKPIRVAPTERLEDALLGTGFYYTKGERLVEEVDIFRRIQEAALGVRRPGSAALDLAFVACGRYAGFWERGLSPWDVAAGMLMVSEAGGRLSDYAGNETTIFAREIVATNGRIHEGILRLIHQA